MVRRKPLHAGYAGPALLGAMSFTGVIAALVGDRVDGLYWLTFGGLVLMIAWALAARRRP